MPQLPSPTKRRRSTLRWLFVAAIVFGFAVPMSLFYTPTIKPATARPLASIPGQVAALTSELTGLGGVCGDGTGQSADQFFRVCTADGFVVQVFGSVSGGRIDRALADRSPSNPSYDANGSRDVLRAVLKTVALPADVSEGIERDYPDAATNDVEGPWGRFSNTGQGSFAFTRAGYHQRAIKDVGLVTPESLRAMKDRGYTCDESIGLTCTKTRFGVTVEVRISALSDDRIFQLMISSDSFTGLAPRRRVLAAELAPMLRALGVAEADEIASWAGSNLRAGRAGDTGIGHLLVQPWFNNGAPALMINEGS